MKYNTHHVITMRDTNGRTWSALVLGSECFTASGGRFFVHQYKTPDGQRLPGFVKSWRYTLSDAETGAKVDTFRTLKELHAALADPLFMGQYEAIRKKARYKTMCERFRASVFADVLETLTAPRVAAVLASVLEDLEALTR